MKGMKLRWDANSPRPGHRLDYGTTVVSGPPDVVRTDPRVLDACLGTAEDDDDIPVS
jgi:hypothetical protein